MDWSFILKYRALLQSNVDVHMLGESATGVYAYKVFLWAIPVCITFDVDVDPTLFNESEWLQANVLLDFPATAKMLCGRGSPPHQHVRDAAADCIKG